MRVELLEVNKPNGNNRVYPKDLMEREIVRYKKTFVDERRAFVCKKQPEDTTVNLIDVIGLVTDIRVQDDKVVAEIEKLNTKDADEYWPLIESGQFSVRTSGIGSLRDGPDGTRVICDDYELTSFFITTNPA